MVARDLTTALACLLSDPSLREAYRQNRRETARELSIGDRDLEAFLSINEVALEAQAETLLNKRFHEVSRLLPQTFSILGQDARAHFLSYAPTYWPRGHRRHLGEAVSFCRYLLDRGIRKVCRAEFNRLRFILSGKRFAVHLVPDLLIEGRPRRALQFQYRLPRRLPRHFALYFDSSPLCAMLHRAWKETKS